MFLTPKILARGVSTVEILIVLGVLSVLLSLAAPSMSTATSQAELRATVENMEYSIHMARLTARQVEREVVMHLQTGTREKHHSISFSIPGQKAGLESDELLQEFQLPTDIRLVSDVNLIHFDSRGLVNSPTSLMLVSNQDADVKQSLLIE